MNQSFDLSRWMLLVSRHWVENRRRYLLALPAMGGLLIAWYSFLLIMVANYRPLNQILQYLAYYFGLFVTGCLYASTLFSELSSKAECTNYLSVPASQLEKLLCALFFGVFLFFISFNLIYYAVDIPMVHLANRLSVERYGNGAFTGASIRISDSPIWNVFEERDTFLNMRYHPVLLAFFAIQSAFILGSVYFTRYAFLKTMVTILICSLGVSFILTKVIAGNLPRGWWLDNIFEWKQVSDTADFNVVRLPLWVEHCLILLTQYSIPLIFWWITYFRLKEKEV